MGCKSKIRLRFLFSEYPVFYQPYIPPVVEGLRKSFNLYLEINAFKSIVKNGVIILPSYYFRKLKEYIYTITHNNSPKLNYLEIQYLKESVDIVHVQHSFLFPKVLGLLQIQKDKRPKIIITLRGGDTYVKPWLQNKWKDFYLNYGNLVDAYVVMSQHQKKYLHEKWGINLDKIHVIPISFGNPKIEKPKHACTDVIRILSAFRMCWEKNIDGNLRVIKQLKERGISVQYDMYGDGPDSGQVHFLIEKYKLLDCVNYHGRIENSKLKSSLSNYDFFLQLSHSEALPTSVIEAQSVGIPAIVSNSGGLPEAIIDKQSGYCVDTFDVETAANSIVQLWENKTMYNNFSKAAISNSHSKFSVKQEVKKLNILYNSLV